MLTRRRKKPRFQLDAPQPRHRQALPVRVVIKPRHKRTRFRVGLEETSVWNALPFQIIVERRARKPKAPLTLGQRRQRQRLTWIASGALVVVVALAGALLASAPSRSQAQLPAATSARATPPALHLYASAPFASLRPYTSAAAGPPPAIQAPAAFLFDPQRGWILFQRDPDTPRPAASLTKIMTLLLAVNSGALDQPVTIGPDAAALVNSDNSYMGVQVGEQLTLRQLLDGLMLVGGNDAARAIADALSGGDEPAFVAAMNAYARQLGLRHVQFVSPDGVSAANQASARDLAILAALAIQQPEVAQISAARQLVIARTATNPGYTLENTNDLLPGASAGEAGVNGLKTGYTPAAGYCMAVTAERNGRLLVGVLLGEPTDAARVSDARALLDWGFAQEQAAG